MRNKSFANRLAELERLEAEAEAKAEAQQAQDAGPPDVASLSHGEAMASAIVGLRRGYMHTWYDRNNQVLWLCETGLRDVEWEFFYRALKERIQPIIDAHRPFVPLFPWEIETAIALIDSGRCDVVPCWPAAHPAARSSKYILRVDLGMCHDAEDEYTVRAVNLAMKTWAQHMGFSESGLWEKTTLEAWRAWLAGLLVDTSENVL